MKITKETLIQLIKEELKVTLNEKRSRFSDRIAIDQARDAVYDFIDAEYSDPEEAKRLKKLYQVGVKLELDGGLEGRYRNPILNPRGTSFDDIWTGHVAQLRDLGVEGSPPGTPEKTSVKLGSHYYEKGLSDAKRILDARQTPFEREGEDYRTEDAPDASPGPYKSLYRARAKARSAQADAKRKTSAQAKNPAGAYQALGDAAMRGSGMAISRLMDAAETDPAAQAILDAVEEAEREAKRKTPLSADLEADMLEEIILEEFEAVLSEADKDPIGIKTRINSYLDHVLGENPNLQYGGIALSNDPDCGPVLGPHDFVVKLTQSETKAEGVEAALSENRALEAAKKTHARKKKALDNAKTAEQKRKLEKAIKDLERRHPQLVKR